MRTTFSRDLHADAHLPRAQSDADSSFCSFGACRLNHVKVKDGLSSLS